MKSTIQATILSLLVFSFAGLAVAEDINPSGTWRWTTDQDGNEFEQEICVEADAKGKYRAVFHSKAYNGAFDGLKAKEVYMDGDKLVVDFAVKTSERSFDAVYKGAVKGHDAEGDLTLSSDDGEMDVPWKAHRSVKMSDVAGKWDLELKGEQEDYTGILVVSKKGDKYVGQYEGENVSECKVAELKADDDTFSFQVTGKVQDMDIVAKFDTKPLGNKLTGDLELSVDGSQMELPVAGKLTKQATLKDLVGTWDLLVQADEEHTPKLIVTEKEGKVAAKFDLGDMGKFDANDLELKDGKLSFNMEGKLDGQDFTAKCVSKVADAKLDGAVLLDLDGEEHELPMTGKLAK